MKFVAFTLALLCATVSAFAPSMPLATKSSLRESSLSAAAAEELYIDDERRFLMNLVVVGSFAVTLGAIGVPFIAFLVPPGTGGGGGGTTAKDAKGFDLIAKDYLASKPAGDRSLAEGLKGDAT
jgi:cytochrome b6-f complex iron-sulfur subunit